MSNNSSKQILLSVIGVAILVIAVVGVSFAFFTYTRTGSSNNQITTGTLSFSFTEDNQISLINHFPISTEQGKALSGNNVITFRITGKTDGNPIPYSIYIVPGDSVEGRTLLKTNEVFLNIKRIDTDPNGTFTGVETGKWVGDNAAAIGDGNILEKTLIGSGHISTSTINKLIFEVRMWVDNSVVSIGETATGGTGPDGTGAPTYTPGEYGTKYFSMKVVVEASA